jgi:hypothetical protein
MDGGGSRSAKAADADSTGCIVGSDFTYLVGGGGGGG